MDLTKVLRILSTNAKPAAIAGIAVAATAGGGAVVAATVADSSPATTTVTSTSAGSDDDANEAPEGQESESPDADKSESPDAEDAGKTDSTDSSGSTVTPVDCGTTAWKNHGAYVSSVAHSTPPAGVSHGDMVSAAAQSDCGKPTPDSTDAPETPKAKSTHSSHSSQGDAHRNSKATTHKNAKH